MPNPDAARSSHDYDGGRDETLAGPGLGDGLRERPVAQAPLEGSDAASVASPLGEGRSGEPPPVAPAAAVPRFHFRHRWALVTRWPIPNTVNTSTLWRCSTCGKEKVRLGY